ncbi:hypothetical protein ACFYKT_19135 [Cytobacillus sp. FJAT-53684]|uniref:Uncharacterized protein n=1 Tax=Cytobacillus mangrovibacter TaxID=3299024 RepID=A0ABW6K2L7_9BACI
MKQLREARPIRGSSELESELEVAEQSWQSFKCWTIAREDTLQSFQH